jgi:hypothetical protein
MKVMAIPLPSENVEAWKAWTRECQGPRREEFDDFNERMGLTRHRVWLTQGPQGNLIIVALDGPGAEDYLQRVASSQEPFDRWFREKASDLSEVDLSRARTVPSAEPSPRPSALRLPPGVPGSSRVAARKFAQTRLQHAVSSLRVRSL